MNEPIQAAQEILRSKPTARDLRALIRSGKGRRSVYMHGEATPNRASYSDSFIFTVTSAREPSGGARVTACLDVPGWVSNGHTDETRKYTPTGDSIFRAPYDVYTGVYRPLKGFWSLSDERILDVLDVLPGDSEVAFHVYLDAGTNQNLVDARMHGDHLYLTAYKPTRTGRVGQTRTFLIDTTCGRHHSARFGGGK